MNANGNHYSLPHVGPPVMHGKVYASIPICSNKTYLFDIIIIFKSMMAKKFFCRHGMPPIFVVATNNCGFIEVLGWA